MILAACGVRFHYASHPVLDGVELAVRQGELVAILGPNGVGKTTLLRCLGAMLRPSQGAVLLDGRDLRRLPAAAVARQVGYVPQRTEATRLTVFDAVLLGRIPHLGWRAQERDLAITAAVLETLGLTPLAMRHADTLSGGELQKVCIARALVQEPRLLLLDEPTSALDLKNQVEIMELIRRVVENHGVAAVMTMHDINTALRVADTCLFLKHGRIHAALPAAEVDAAIITEVYGIEVAVHRVDGHGVVIPKPRGVCHELPRPA